jgi:death on curing protein
MRYLTLSEVLELYRRLIEQTGGGPGIRDLGSLQSAQVHMTFGGQELYPTIVEKAAPLGFSIIRNHPFVDADKRTGHAAMETFLVLNGFEIDAPADEQERIILGAASGEIRREDLVHWLQGHIVASHP